jgi:hypothetical protein
MSEIYIVYGITDCPACLRACADLMELDRQYVFVEMDFSSEYRNLIKERYNWGTFPIIVTLSNAAENVIGGYSELSALTAPKQKSAD